MGRPPQLSDSELVTVAVAQALLGFHSETRLRYANVHLVSLCPGRRMPGQTDTAPTGPMKRQPAQTSASSAGTVVARPSSLRAATDLFGSIPVNAGS